jgi:hypothetical protein
MISGFSGKFMYNGILCQSVHLLDNWKHITAYVSFVSYWSSDTHWWLTMFL